jgi:succinate dehydrogenase hydrophobic anchor subunit
LTPRLLRVAWLLIEATALPLFALALIYLLTGYQILNPRVAIIPRARLLHIDTVLRIVAAVFFLAHSYGGLILTISKYVKKQRLRELLFIAVNALILGIAGLLVGLELALRG